MEGRLPRLPPALHGTQRRAAQRRDRLAPTARAEHGPGGDEYSGPRARRERDRLRADPAVHLERDVESALVDPAPQRLDLAQHAGDELLAAEARVDGHHEHLVDVA